MTRLLDAYADVLPYGLQPTPFGEVWHALQVVASTVWNVDPAVYRAGIAWGWYVQHNPDALAAQRDLVIAALISEQAPLIKADQTTAELVEYLRQWREYRPTYDRLEAIYKLFAADVDILPVSTPGAPPVSDTRLAFYVRIYGVDFSRLLTLEEAYTIAIRATPLGSRPIVYYEFDEQLSVDTQPLKAGIASINYENDAICEPVELNHYTFIVADATTGQIVSGFSNELVYGEIEGIILQSPRLVYGVDVTVPTAQFWFTENGRNETESTVLQPNSTVTVYDENGDTITDEDTIGMYDTASVLAYMQADGDMLLKQDDVFIDNDGELGLQVDSGPISAWSVFAERVFTLSFANTQLPDITITMPADETGHKGTSITLPTMSGEYESGGKTWKPSAWDIGAFGSSYTLNADVVAHLVFEEVQQYEEITLYFSSSSNFAMQGKITSGFTGNVNSAYIYQLYTDAEHTTPWNGYDYSNDYEIGYYSSGNWVKRPIVQEMPDSTTSEQSSVISWILLDTGYVWGVSNIDTASRTLTFGNGSITVRIYPKDKQYYAFYLSTSSVYNNSSVSNNSTGSLKGKPGISSAQTVPWNVNDATLPTRTIYKLLGSAGNELSRTGIDWRDPSLGYKFYQIANSSGQSISLRAVVFSLSVPTSYSYPNNINTNATINSSTNYQMFDEKGNAVQFDSTSAYRVIGMFKANGDASDNTFSNYNKMELYSNANGILCLGYTGSGTITFYKVWYIKTPI